MDTEFYTVPRLSSKPRFTYLGAGSALLTCAVTHAASAASGGLAARRAVRPPAAMQSLSSRSATAHTSLPLLFVRARPLPAPSAVPQLAASTLVLCLSSLQVPSTSFPTRLPTPSLTLSI